MINGENSYKRYLEGDESAFDEVLELYFNNLTLFINGYLNDVHASEDVAVDTMLELIVHKKRFDFRSSLKTYLFSIARHKALDYVKKHRRVLPVSPDEIEIADRSSLEQDVLESEEKRRLHAALLKLDVDLRTAVHLVYIEGLSYKEASGVMKKSHKQLDNLIVRAKKALKKELILAEKE